MDLPFVFPLLSNGINRVNVRTETFAVRYRMNSTKIGCYFFLSVGGDDGVRVYVDGVLVFNEWKDQATTNYCNNLIYLDGDSDIVFDFYENAGGNAANFSLAQFIPSSNTISNPSTINVCSEKIVQDKVNGSAYSYCANANTSPNISFQWQVSTTDESFVNIVGATAEDYTPPTITTTTSEVRFYRRILRANASNATSCQFETNVIRVNTSAASVLY